MINKANKKKDTEKPITKCEKSKEVVAKCDQPEEVIANSFLESDPRSSGENPQETSLSQYYVTHLLT